MAKSLSLQILTPAETLLDVENVAWIQVQLADGGGLGIWPGHAPLLAETVRAPVRYAETAGPSGEANEPILDLEAGILQIDRNGVTIFTSGPASAASVPDRPPYQEEFDRAFDNVSWRFFGFASE